MTDGLHEDRAAVCVVAGVGDVLDVEGVEETAPGVEVVVGLEDVLACVTEGAITEEEALAAELQVGLVVALDGVRDEGEAGFVEGAVVARRL